MAFASPRKVRRRADSHAIRVELTRERIVAAALRLVDRQGLDALNMRSLGAALGASTMSVYRHFRDKDDLLNAVVDTIVAGFAPAVEGGAWRDRARGMSLTVRAAMLAHPELADLIGREFRRSATSLRVNTEIIESLSQSGVPKSLLAETYWAISCYTTGHALLEAQALRRKRARSGRGATPQQRARKLEDLLRSIDGVAAGSIPRAAQVLSRPLGDRQFLFGLECMLDGIDARFAAYRQA